MDPNKSHRTPQARPEVRLGASPLQDAFVAHVRPQVERHARVEFRKHRDREELAADCVALAWKWFVRMAERGKDATRFPTAVATYVARAVRAGRRVTGQLPARDAMSEVAQKRHGFYVGKLPDFTTLEANPIQEALIDNTLTPPCEQAAFRIDFPAWLATFSRRDRALIRDMDAGERTGVLARRYGLSPGRVSQLRRDACQSWDMAHG